MPRAPQATTGAPFVKLVNLGDVFVGAWAGSAQRQRRNFKTRELEVKENGKPALEEILHFIAMPGTTANIGNDPDYRPVDLGAHVRYSVSGFQWGQVIDARKALPALTAGTDSWPAGQIVSSDVYTVSVAGWSAATDNAAAATKAGFTVVDGRIIMRNQEEKDQYVLARSRQNQTTSVGKDLTIAVRRIELPNEQKWADLADELYDTEPWEATPAAAGGGEYADDGAPHPAEADVPDEEPF